LLLFLFGILTLMATVDVQWTCLQLTSSDEFTPLQVR
jgi:hypothetical protein